MDLPATQVCYDYEDEPTQKITECLDKTKEQVGVLIVNSKPHPIYKGINKVGRHPECDILLNDQSVSKYHAEIEASIHSSAWICDLKSSNKTVLNNVTLRPSRFYELKDNSVIEFGRIKATYQNHTEKDKDFVIPETPIQSKQKSIKAVIPGTPDSLLSNSSTFAEDSSTIASTQTRLTNSADLLLQKVLKNNNKKSDSVISLNSDNEQQSETNKQNKDNKSIILKDNDKSIDCSSDQNKKNLLQPSPGINRSSMEATKSSNICEPNDPSTSCESDDIFEAATQRVNINMDFTNRRVSCSSDETNIDEDAIIDDMAPILKICNRLESSTPIRNTNVEKQLEKMKNIQSDIALATKCLNMKEDVLKSNENNTKKSVKENENTVDDIDTLETQEMCLPNSINILKGVRIVKNQSDAIDVIDTQIINTSDLNHDENNVKENAKKNDIADISLLDTQPISTNNTADNNISSSAKENIQQKATNNGSIEDLDYEMASTQIINEAEEMPKKLESKTKNSSNSKGRKTDFDDSLEQKLNDMFEGVNDDEVTETSMVSTQILQNVLESSQRNCQTASTPSRSVNDVLLARVQDIKTAESNSQESQPDSQNSEKYFSKLITKRKHNVLTDSQENIESNIAASSRRNSRTGIVKANKNDDTLIRTSPRRNTKEKLKATNPANTANHVEKHLLNSFEVSVHSSKEDTECTETSNSLDEKDDDILTLLPEVNISGTLSNPATASSTSLVQKKRPTRRSSNKKANKKSKVLQAKPTTESTSNLTDDMDYENLKKMAEELISNTNNEKRSRRTRTNAKETLSTASEVSKESKTTKLKEKSVANAKGRKSKGNITTESNTILTYVTRKSPRNTTESTSEINSNVVPVNSEKKQTKKQSTNTKVIKQNSNNNMKNNKSDSEVGKESQEVEMIMNKSVTTATRNTRKRKKTNPSPDTSNNSEAPVKEQIINEYKVPPLRIKRAKFDKSNSLHSSIDSIATEDSLISENESSTATSVTKSRSTRSKRVNKEEPKNKSNTSIPDKINTRNSPSIGTENSKETISVPSTPTIRSSSRLSTSLNSSFSVKEKILFTGITDDDYVKVLKTLGGVKVEDPSKCTILVTDKIRRTIKFLSALARAVPIVSISWIQESKRTGYFLDWENYMLKDPAMEAKYGFRLRKSLDKAREQKLLEGYTVLLTPNLGSPPISELRSKKISYSYKIYQVNYLRLNFEILVENITNISKRIKGTSIRTS